MTDNDSYAWYGKETIQPWVERVMVATALLSILAVSLRLYSRRLNRQALWWDDWLAIFNLFWFFLVIGAVIATLTYGLGLHIEHVTSAEYKALIKIALVFDVLYLWSLVWSKLSILLMYYRVFCFGYFKKAAFGIGGLVVVLAIVSTFMTGFLCIPLSKVWDVSVTGYCPIDETDARLFNSASTIFTDLLILCLPVPQVWSLQLRRMQKIAVTCIFGFGCFVVFAAGFRISIFLQDYTGDDSYTLAPDAGWTLIELSAAITSASIPAVGPALIQLYRKVTSSGKSGLGIFSKKTSGDSPRKGDTKRSNRTINTDSGDGGDTRKAGGAFYRLSDLQAQNSFRTAHSDGIEGRGRARTVDCEEGERIQYREGAVTASQDDGASDEVPLSAILVCERTVIPSNTGVGSTGQWSRSNHELRLGQQCA